MRNGRYANDLIVEVSVKLSTGEYASAQIVNVSRKRVIVGSAEIHDESVRHSLHQGIGDLISEVEAEVHSDVDALNRKALAQREEQQIKEALK